MSWKSAIRNNSKKIKLTKGLEIAEPMVVDLTTGELNLDKYIENRDKSEIGPEPLNGHFELYFSSGDFATRSAPTDDWVAVIPAIKAIGVTPSYTIFKLIDLDTEETLKSISLRSFSDGEKWIFRYYSNNGNYPFPFMPDHDWHLRVQLEYPEGTVYTQKDVTIINGPRSGLNPKCEVIKPTLPTELAPDSDLMIPHPMKNIGDEVGRIGQCGYVTPNWRNLTFIDILPTHPEFNSTGLGISFKMPRYHEYLRWVGYSYSWTEGKYIQDGNVEEHTILCTDPAKCDCSECDTEHGCYEHSYHNDGNSEQNCCYWDNSMCKIPDKSCKPYPSEFIEYLREDTPTCRCDESDMERLL